MGAVSKTEIPRPGGGRGGNERGASSKRQNGTATWVGNSSSGHLPEKVKKLTREDVRGPGPCSPVYAAVTRTPPGTRPQGTTGRWGVACPPGGRRAALTGGGRRRWRPLESTVRVTQATRRGTEATTSATRETDNRQQTSWTSGRELRATDGRAEAAGGDGRRGGEGGEGSSEALAPLKRARRYCATPAQQAEHRVSSGRAPSSQVASGSRVKWGSLCTAAHTQGGGPLPGQCPPQDTEVPSPRHSPGPAPRPRAPGGH